MARRHIVGEHRLRRIVAHGQHLPHGVGEGHDGRDGVGGGVGLVVAEYGFDVFVARDHPVVDGRAVEDRLLAACAGEHGEGVAQVERVEGVERAGRHGIRICVHYNVDIVAPRRVKKQPAAARTTDVMPAYGGPINQRRAIASEILCSSREPSSVVATSQFPSLDICSWR